MGVIAKKKPFNVINSYHAKAALYLNIYVCNFCREYKIKTNIKNNDVDYCLSCYQNNIQCYWVGYC